MPSDKTCESIDPTVGISVYYSGDTSACTFVWNVNWGDGASTTNLAQADPADGYQLLANHTYATPGKYTITDTGQVTAGNCTATSGVHTFTLDNPPSPIPTVRFGKGWSGYTTYIPRNAKGQPTSKEYYADARWTVPHLDCNAIHHPIIGANSSVAMWVGLGGVGLPKDPASGNLVQAGILSRCRAYFQVDEAVYQILPPDTSSIALDAKHPVKPGDSVEVTVEQHSKYVYSMEINDTTQRWVWAKDFTVSFGNVPDSADYIVEKPGTYQADFGTVTFHMSNYTTFPLGSCLNCGPEFLNAGYPLRFIGINLFSQDVAKVGPISSPVSTDPGTFSVTWKRGS